MKYIIDLPTHTWKQNPINIVSVQHAMEFYNNAPDGCHDDIAGTVLEMLFHAIKQQKTAP